MMGPSEKYFAALFKSVSHVMHAERILKEADVPHKIIPIPRIISSDCGICIRYAPEDSIAFKNTLTGKVDTYEVRSL